MSYFTMGDYAQYRMLSRQGQRLRDQMNELSVEATTGLVANQTARLKGNYTQVAGIESRLAQIAAFRTVSTETQVVAQVMQTSITTIADRTTDLGKALLAGASSASAVRIDALGDEAASKLDGILSALNVRIGERSLFSGTDAHQATFGTGTELLDALSVAVTAAGALSSVDVKTAVDDWFADPLGFEATMYHGGAQLGAVPVGTDQTVQVDVTGMDPALVEAIKGVALTGLLSRGVMAGSAVARADLAQLAGESLVGTQQLLAALGARLGTTEAEMQNAVTRNDAEKNALEQARLDLLSVDGYETAAKFQETQGQLSTLYTLTSRASRLSLVDYL